MITTYYNYIATNLLGRVIIIGCDVTIDIATNYDQSTKNFLE